MLLAKLRKKPLSVWELRLFCAAYTILIWVVWQFLTYDGNSVRTMPAMFWGYVFYRLARSAFEKKTTPAIPPDEQPEERWYTCSKCGQLVRDGEKCDCEQVAPAQEEQPEVAEKRSGWQRILLYIGYLLLAVFFVLSLLAAMRNNREPEICVRCSSEEELTASCPCCSAPICQSCFADIEYEHSKSAAEASADVAPSFSEWIAAPYSMPRWRHLYDAGYISLSYEEWQQFTNEMHDGVASEFLREKAKEQREKADREYGPTAYGSTCWDLWYKLTDAGHTTAAFDDFAEAYKLNTDE